MLLQNLRANFSKLCRKAFSGKSLLRTFLDWSSERKHRTDDKWVHGECKCPSDITYCPRWQPQPWRWKVWTTYFNGWHTSPKIINLNRFLPRQKASRLSSAAVVRHLVKSLIPIPADFCQKPLYPPAPSPNHKKREFRRSFAFSSVGNWTISFLSNLLRQLKSKDKHRLTLSYVEV